MPNPTASRTIDVVADGNDVVVRSGAIELFRAPGAKLKSLDITGTDGDDTLNLANLDAIFAGLIGGDAGGGNEVNFGGGWTLTGSQISGDRYFHQLEQNGATLLLNGPAVWQNPVNRNDAKNSGASKISPQADILPLINEAKQKNIIASDGRLPLAPTGTIAVYFDINGDGFLTPAGDILRQINLANLQAAETEGEGENAAPRFVFLPAGDATVDPGATIFITPPAPTAAEVNQLPEAHDVAVPVSPRHRAFQQVGAQASARRSSPRTAQREDVDLFFAQGEPWEELFDR